MRHPQDIAAGIEAVERGNLAVEPTRGLRGPATAVRLDGEGIQLGLREAVQVGQPLGRLALVDDFVFFLERGIDVGKVPDVRNIGTRPMDSMPPASA